MYVRQEPLIRAARCAKIIVRVSDHDIDCLAFALYVCMHLADAGAVQAFGADEDVGGTVHQLATKAPGGGTAAASHGGSAAAAGNEAVSVEHGTHSQGQAPPLPLGLDGSLSEQSAIANGGHIYQLAASTPTDDDGAALYATANAHGVGSAAARATNVSDGTQQSHAGATNRQIYQLASATVVGGGDSALEDDNDLEHSLVQRALQAVVSRGAGARHEHAYDLADRGGTNQHRPQHHLLAANSLVSRTFSNVSTDAAVCAMPSDGSGSEPVFVFTHAPHAGGSVAASIFRTTSDV